MFPNRLSYRSNFKHDILFDIFEAAPVVYAAGTFHNLAFWIAGRLRILDRVFTGRYHQHSINHKEKKTQDWLHISEHLPAQWYTFTLSPHCISTNSSAINLTSKTQCLDISYFPSRAAAARMPPHICSEGSFQTYVCTIPFVFRLTILFRLFQLQKTDVIFLRVFLCFVWARRRCGWRLLLVFLWNGEVRFRRWLFA